MTTRVDIIPVSNKVVNERNRLCYMKEYPMQFKLTRVGRWWREEVVVVQAEIAAANSGSPFALA